MQSVPYDEDQYGSEQPQSFSTRYLTRPVYSMLRNSFKDNPAVEGSIHFEDVVPTTPEEPADRPYLKENGEGGDLGVSEN